MRKFVSLLVNFSLLITQINIGYSQQVFVENPTGSNKDPDFITDEGSVEFPYDTKTEDALIKSYESSAKSSLKLFKDYTKSPEEDTEYGSSESESADDVARKQAVDAEDMVDTSKRFGKFEENLKTKMKTDKFAKALGKMERLKSSDKKHVAKADKIDKKAVIKQATFLEDETPIFDISSEDGSKPEHCEFNLKADHYIALKYNKVKDPKTGKVEIGAGGKATTENYIKYSVAVLGFEFLAQGETEDYWKEKVSTRDSNGRVTTKERTLSERLKLIATASRKRREKLFEQMDEKNLELTCKCVYTQGPEKYVSVGSNVNAVKSGDEKGNDDSSVTISSSGPGVTAEKRKSGKIFQEKCTTLFNKWLAEKGEREKKRGDLKIKEEYGDASGLKYQILLKEYSEMLADMASASLVNTSDTFADLYKITEWAMSKNWNETKVEEKELYQFKVWTYSSSAQTGMVLGALLASGVVAVLGGFADHAMVASWGAATSISAAAAFWVIGAIQGAWKSKFPNIKDEKVGEDFVCKEKGTKKCQKWKRMILKPHNDICNMDISANACIKSFLVFNDTGSEKNTYLVDPWIPMGMRKRQVVSSQRDYAKMLDSSAKAAIPTIQKESAEEYRKSGQEMAKSIVKEMGSLSKENVKKGMGYQTITDSESGEATNEGEVDKVIGFLKNPAQGDPESITKYLSVKPDYLEYPFLDSVRVGIFAKDLVKSFISSPSRYKMKSGLKKNVIKGAVKYLLDQKFLPTTARSKLEGFGNYVWMYHYVWPKLSSPGVIAYPPPGLFSYLTLISNGIGKLADSSNDKREGMNSLAGKIKAITTPMIAALNQMQGTSLGAIDDEKIDNNKLNIAGDGEGETKKSVGFERPNMGTSLDGLGGAISGGADDIGSVGILGEGFIEPTAENVRKAVADLNRIKKDILKRKEHWDKNVGNTERGENLKNAASRLQAAIYPTPDKLGSYNNAAPAYGDSSAPSGKGPTVIPADEEEKEEDEKVGSKGGSGSKGSAKKRPKFSFGGLFGKKGSKGQRGSKFGGGSTIGGRGSLKDLAKQSKNKKQFAEDDGDSLWEKITKAYYRSIQRLIEGK